MALTTLSTSIGYGHNSEDVPRLYELEEACFNADFRWTREDFVEALTGSDIWVARADDGLIVGFLLSELETNKRNRAGHISSINVDPDFRRQGIGASLLEVAEKHYQEAGATGVILEVHRDNPAQTLYFKLGYRVTAIKHGYYSDNSTALLMTKGF